MQEKGLARACSIIIRSQRVVAAFMLAVLCGIVSTARADEYVVRCVQEQNHSLYEDLGKSNATHLSTSYSTLWYVVANPEAAEWDAELTYPRGATGLQQTPAEPGSPYVFTFPGWEAIRHNGQKFYLSDFVYPFGSDYEMFTSALEIVLNPALTDENGTYHITTIHKIGDYAFAGSNIACVNLALLSDIMPDQTDQDIEIGDYAFADCRSYKGVPEGSPYRILPDCVKKLGTGVFKGCVSLERMIVGDGIEVLPAETFDGCTSLRELKLGSGMRRVECSVTSLDRLVLSSPEPPEIAPGCVLEAKEVWVPAQYEQTYRTAMPGSNIKAYSFSFSTPVVEAYAGYQAEVNFTRVSPGSGENDYVYCYPRGLNSSGKQNMVWQVDSVHGSDSPTGKFKTVWYSYSCDQPELLSAGNVVYEDQTLVRFNKAGTYRLRFTTLDITDHTEEVTVEVMDVPAGTVFPDKIIISANVAPDHSVAVGKTLQLRATLSNTEHGTPTIKTVSWGSSNGNVAKVDENGLVTAVSPGTATITAQGFGPVAPVAQFCVNVYQPILSHVLERQNGDGWEEFADGNNYRLTIPVGEAMRLRPRCYPEGLDYEGFYISKDMFAKPENMELAEVEIDESAGYVKILSTGYVQLNVAVRGKSYYRENPVRIFCVEPKPVSYIAVSRAGETGGVLDEANGIDGMSGEEIALDIDYNYDAEMKRVEWSSSNAAVAEVVTARQRAADAAEFDGVPVTAATLVMRAPGSATITACAADGSGVQTSFDVEVASSVVKVPVSQRACVTNTSSQLATYTNDMYFMLSTDGTATLTYPRSDNGVESSYPDNPYEFSFVGYDATYRAGSYKQLWSRYMDESGFSGRDLYYTALSIPETISHGGREYTVTRIGDYAFAGSNVRYINIPATVETIGDYAFKNDTAFVGLARPSEFSVIPNSVKSIGKGLFSGCTALGRMVFGSGITRIPEETFDGCESLSSVEVGRNVRSIACDIATPGSNAFIVMNPVEPPVFEGGATVDATGSAVYVKPESLESYKALLPDARVESYSVTATFPEAVYANEKMAVSYKVEGPWATAANDYIFLYPATAADGSQSASFSWSGECLIMEFGDARNVGEACDLQSVRDRWYVSFREPGEQDFSLRGTMVTDMMTELHTTVLPGTPIKSITLTQPESNINLGDRIKLDYSIAPANAANPKVVWKFSKEGVVEVDDNGFLTAIGAGKVTITAESADPYCTKRTSKPIEVTVIKTVSDIKLYADSHEVGVGGVSGYPGDKIRLSVKFNPDDAYPETCGWTVTTAIGSVSGDNENVELELTAPGRGLATFRLTQKTGITSMTADVPVFVKTPVTSIALQVDGVGVGEALAIAGEVDDVRMLSATANEDAYDTALEWSSSDEEVAALRQVAGGYELVMLKSGSAVVTIAAADSRGACVKIAVTVTAPEEDRKSVV